MTLEQFILYPLMHRVVTEQQVAAALAMRSELAETRAAIAASVLVAHTTPIKARRGRKAKVQS
jgi:hypothetical protein